MAWEDLKLYPINSAKPKKRKGLYDENVLMSISKRFEKTMIKYLQTRDATIDNVHIIDSGIGIPEIDASPIQSTPSIFQEYSAPQIFESKPTDESDLSDDDF